MKNVKQIVLLLLCLINYLIIIFKPSDEIVGKQKSINKYNNSDSINELDSKINEFRTKETR